MSDVSEPLVQVVECGHSRIPVHMPGADKAIVGLVLTKELLHALMPGKQQRADEDSAAGNDGGEEAPLAEERRGVPVADAIQKTLSSSMMIRSIPKLNKDTVWNAPAGRLCALS